MKARRNSSSWHSKESARIQTKISLLLQGLSSLPATFSLHQGTLASDKWLEWFSNGRSQLLLLLGHKTWGNRGHVCVTELERLTGKTDRKATIIKPPINLWERQQTMHWLWSHAAWVTCVEVICCSLAAQSGVSYVACMCLRFFICQMEMQDRTLALWQLKASAP